jgi:phosphatidyl-myo-inositol dimannoside synthase
MESPGILLLSELYPPTIGGSGVLLESLYSRLADHRVHVITDGIGWRVQRDLPVTAIRMSAPDWGIVHHASLARHLRVARAVRRRTSRRSVVHCSRGLPEGLSAAISGRRFLCWTHGEELGYASTSRELRWLLPRVYKRASAIVANSRNSAQLLAHWGVQSDAVTVVHPGVDVQRFRPDVDPGSWRARYAGPGELILLSVGRLQKRKGHDLMLAALAKWRPEDPPVRYLVAGGGDRREALEQQAAQLGVQNRVRFLGVVPESELPSLYAAADIFVMPNRVDGVDFEGFGIVFLEAAAAGLPCIGGRSGGAPEAVEDGETGVLVGGDNPDELAVVLRRLACSPEARSTMGARGRERVAREFTWELGARRLSDLQRQLENRTAARALGK